MIALFIIFFISIYLSAFFAGSEMAFVSVNKLKLRKEADSGNVRARSVLRLHKKPQFFLTSVLIGNNITNVVSTVILTYLLKTQFDINNEWIVMAIMLPILIIFAEMVPKDYCRIKAMPFLLNQYFWLKWVQKIFYLPSFLFLKLINLFLPPLNANRAPDIFVNEEEFRSLIEESTRTGIVGAHEEKLINTILDFERIQVRSVMMPIEKVPMVNITSTVRDVKEFAKGHKTKMILVYEEIPAIVVGMIYVFDLLLKGEDADNLRKFLRSPVFIPKTMSIEKAFLTLQAK